MANHNSTPLELLRKAGVDHDLDFPGQAVGTLAQSRIELEASQVMGAEPYERRAERTNLTGHDPFSPRVGAPGPGTSQCQAAGK